ncbi:hypothetical protein SLS62_004936 [Diatrype stigma]|uniref:PDGLE domain-containing protein n=1 Tax=Diatrype stigma TaxID=117547 RepID=A0AAN9YSJ6_9PEZI
MAAFLSLAFTVFLLLANVALAAPTGYERGDLEASDLAWLEAVQAVDVLKRQVAGYKNDPADGSYLKPGEIAAIVVGAVCVLVLVGVLILCGRAGRWPRKGGRK